ATRADRGPVFVGIGPRGAVDRYLAGVAHDDLTDIDVSPFRAKYHRVTGEAQPEPPTTQSFWVAKATGEGTRTLTGGVKDGRWSVVVMNADADPGVAADVSIGAKTNLLLAIGIGLLVLFAILGAAATVMLVLGARHPRSPDPAMAAAGHAPSPSRSS